MGYARTDVGAPVPDVTVIAPWREWDFRSRESLLAFAEQHQIPIAKDKRGEAPFSVDANLLHSSSEGKVLEDPAKEAPSIVYQRTISPMEAPDKATEVRIGFERAVKACRPTACDDVAGTINHGDAPDGSGHAIFDEALDRAAQRTCTELRVVSTLGKELFRRLREFDADLGRVLAEEMRKKGVDIRFGRNIEKLQKNSAADGALLAQLDDGSTLPTDLVLAATGRHAKPRGICLGVI